MVNSATTDARGPRYRSIGSCPGLGRSSPAPTWRGFHTACIARKRRAHTSGFVPLLSLMLRPFAILATLAPKRAVTATAYLSRGLSLSL